MTRTIQGRLLALETRTGHRCLECEIAVLNGADPEPCRHPPGAQLMNALRALNDDAGRNADAED